MPANPTNSNSPDTTLRTQVCVPAPDSDIGIMAQQLTDEIQDLTYADALEVLVKIGLLMAEKETS